MIATTLTGMFELLHPIILAPMGGVAGGALAAAVSNAGGLGLVGGGYGDAEWLRSELDRVRQQTQRPWGVGLITWAIERSILDLALSYRPHAFMLSFGDPRPYADAIKETGSKLVCQVQDLQAAHLAQEAGADVIVAQGTEAGGHGGTRSTFPLVPAVVDAVAPIPVVAAGGIADGRGLAAALVLGAQGALMGTRFYASAESMGSDRAKQRIVAADGDETARTRVFDIVRNYAWPERYTGRALRNRFMERWHGCERDLEQSLESQQPLYKAATQQENYDTAMVWAGEVVDLVENVENAAVLVGRISADAEACLRRGAGLLR